MTVERARQHSSRAHFTFAALLANFISQAIERRRSRERSLPLVYSLLRGRASARVARYSDTLMHSTPAFRWIFLNYVPDLRTTEVPHPPTLATLEDRVTVHDANLMLTLREAALCATETRRTSDYITANKSLKYFKS